MSAFVSRVNRITGQMEWDFRDEDYDYKQEIARWAFFGYFGFRLLLRIIGRMLGFESYLLVKD